MELIIVPLEFSFTPGLKSKGAARINPATGYVATLVGKFDTDIQHGIEFAHQMGRFDTVSINSLEFAHLVGKFDIVSINSLESPHLVGKFDTVSINGLEFPHQVGKFDTVLNIGLEFAHLLKIVYRFSWDCFTVGKFDTEFEDGV